MIPILLTLNYLTSMLISQNPNHQDTFDLVSMWLILPFVMNFNQPSLILNVWFWKYRHITRYLSHQQEQMTCEHNQEIRSCSQYQSKTLGTHQHNIPSFVSLKIDGKSCLEILIHQNLILSLLICMNICQWPFELLYPQLRTAFPQQVPLTVSHVT